MSKSSQKHKKGAFGIGGQARLVLRDKQYRAAKKKEALAKRKATLEAKKKEESLNNKPVV